MENCGDYENKKLTAAIETACREQTEESVIGVMKALRESMETEGQILVAMEQEFSEPENPRFVMRGLHTNNGGETLAAFTSLKEMRKGKIVPVLFYSAADFLEDAARMEWCGGILFNPWGESFYLPKDLIPLIPGV